MITHESSNYLLGANPLKIQRLQKIGDQPVSRIVFNIVSQKMLRIASRKFLARRREKFEAYSYMLKIFLKVIAEIC